ncbi:hypothetical protein CIK05_07300 [Bdellovibrio sp. qaytius]|nr:hypothetical protein CIK05_07300 [Bdellovibrio sp. qaytius]
MKTLTKLISTLLLTAATTYIVACDKNIKSSTTQVLPVYQNCVNCGGVITGSEFFRSESTDYNQTFLLNLNFTGSNTVAAPYYGNLNYGSPIINYSGPVAVTGTLNIAIGTNAGGCLIQPGQYTLSTLQAGTWSNSIVSSLRVQAYGPSNMIISIPMAQVAAKRYDQMGRLWSEIPQIGRIFGDVIIENVNGYRCYSDILVN